jgi:hypothetical protein
MSQVLERWVNDIPDGDLYELIIFDNHTIFLCCGRFAHSSGSKFCSWDEFIEGNMQDDVIRSVGLQALQEAQEFLSRQKNKERNTWWQFWVKNKKLK